MPTEHSVQREPSGFSLLAHAMGMAARRAGDNALENPFADEPGAFTAWLDGWMAAARPA